MPTLVTAVNTGHPTLSNRSEPYQEPFDRNLPTHSRLLNAVATILVRNIEVVAVTVHYPFSHRQDSYLLLVIQQSPENMKLTLASLLLHTQTTRISLSSKRIL
jgi:hypothetical protein